MSIRNMEGIKGLTINFPFSLWYQFREHCQTHNTTMKDIVVDLVEAYLQKQEIKERERERNGNKGDK